MTTPQVYGGYGVTGLQNLELGMNTMMAAARMVREYKGQISQLCERHSLMRGSGYSWIEPRTGKVVAQDITPNQELDNPQQISIVDRLVITPTAKAVQVMITDDVKKRLDQKVWRQMGAQAQNAINRKMDIDGLTAFNLAGLSLGAAGGDFDHSTVRRARTRISHGGGEEMAMGAIRLVAHEYQLFDIENRLMDNVDSTNYGELSQGYSADMFRNGFRGKIGDVDTFVDGNIPVNGNDDAYAVIFPKEGMVIINDDVMSNETVRRGTYGEGADLVVHRSKYAYGPRNAHIWSARILSDCSAPS